MLITFSIVVTPLFLFSAGCREDEWERAPLHAEPPIFLRFPFWAATLRHIYWLVIFPPRHYCHAAARADDAITPLVFSPSCHARYAVTPLYRHRHHIIIRWCRVTDIIFSTIIYVFITRYFIEIYHTFHFHAEIMSSLPYFPFLIYLALFQPLFTYYFYWRFQMVFTY